MLFAQALLAGWGGAAMSRSATLGHAPSLDDWQGSPYAVRRHPPTSPADEASIVRIQRTYHRSA